MTEEAQRFVTRTFGDRATRLTPLGAGEWSVAYAFNLTLDAKPAVIRFGNYVEDFRKDRAMAAYSEKALPVPAVIEIGETDTGFFAVSERAPGQVINDLDATGMRAVLPGLLAALDAIRDIKVSADSGYGRWPPGLDALPDLAGSPPDLQSGDQSRPRLACAPSRISRRLRPFR